MPDQLHILFEDNHCIAVAKPAGLLTQAPAGIPNLEAMVKAYLKEKHQKPGNVYLGVPHRLDRPVSGVVLFARNSKSAQRLAEQFRPEPDAPARDASRSLAGASGSRGNRPRVVKLYWGAVAGSVEPVEGVWEDWLRKIPDEARAEKTDPGMPDAKQALMRYRVLQAIDGGTLVEFQPQTGRMHQIRVQAAVRGRPLFGDELYGSSHTFGPRAELARDRIIALHGRSLTFLHPLRYEPMTLTAPLPAIWTDLGVALE
jgi:23S rRNA pseudouridine1911/1915/1917 synthase